MRVHYRKFEMPPLFEKTWLAKWKGGAQPAKSAPLLKLLFGSSETFYLAHTWISELSFQGFRVHILDCAIRFNAFLLAEEAFRRGASAEYILSKVTIQRAFTPYQILDALQETMKALQTPKNKDPVIPFILAPCKQFFDGDVAEDESLFLLKKMTNIFEEYSQLGLPLVVVEKQNYKNRHFPDVLNRIEFLSGDSWALESVYEEGKKAGSTKRNKIKYRLHNRKNGSIPHQTELYRNF